MKKTYSREEVEALIADGNLIVIHKGRVLKLNNWIIKHPGGDKAIQHMVGRDATLEMDVYHSSETLSKVGAFAIGVVETPWKNFRPPIQGGKFRTRQQIELDEGIALSDADEVIKCPSEQTYIENFISEYDQKLVEFDNQKYPSTDVKTQQRIVERFAELHERLYREGYFQCNYWGYFRDFLRIAFLLTCCVTFFQWRGPQDKFNMWLSLSGFCLGLAWHQMTFIVHDAGHLGITHNYLIDNVVSILIADYCGGLSVGWWKRNHNVHHLVTNDPVHDPDIQHLPFFAISVQFFNNVYSTFYEKVLYFDVAAQCLVKLQNYLYYPILCFGRFNLYRLSWEYVLRGQGPRHGKAAWFRWFELVGLAVFFYWFFYRVVACSLDSASQRWTYVMVSHVASMPVHLQIVLSHFAMSTVDIGLNESFPQRQSRTTQDVDCPPWFDYVHGGLQFQLVHHLFPRMPKHNLRKAQKWVIEFCQENDLCYTIYGFADSNKMVLGRLSEIAKQAKILAECNAFCQQELMSELKEMGK